MQCYLDAILFVCIVFFNPEGLFFIVTIQFTKASYSQKTTLTDDFALCPRWKNTEIRRTRNGHFQSKKLSNFTTKYWSPLYVIVGHPVLGNVHYDDVIVVIVLISF